MKVGNFLRTEKEINILRNTLEVVKLGVESGIKTDTIGYTFEQIKQIWIIARAMQSTLEWVQEESNSASDAMHDFFKAGEKAFKRQMEEEANGTKSTGGGK